MMLNANGEFVHERALLVLAQAATRLGIAIDIAALAPSRHRSEHDAFVPTAEYATAVRAIFRDPRETLGIDLAGALPTEAAGLWGFLLRSSPTFGDMLRRAQRYLRLTFRYTRFELVDEPDRVALVCEHPTPAPFGRNEQEICFFLAQWLTWGRSLVGSDVALEQVRMRWSGPTNPTPFHDFFRLPVSFAANDDALVFSRRVLELPLLEQTPELANLFEDYAGAMIQRMGQETTFADRVRVALSEGLLTGASSEVQIAERLGVTPRTLHRRLREESTSFRQVRRDLLLTRAQQMLQATTLPIAEVAYLLGYSEPAAFHRAFRRWTGVSPGQWRERT